MQCFAHRHRILKHPHTKAVQNCSECSLRPCQWRCDTCQDVYCTKCYHSLHRGGRRRHITYLVPFLTPAQHAATTSMHMRQQAAVDAMRPGTADPMRPVTADMAANVAAKVLQGFLRRWRVRRMCFLCIFALVELVTVVVSRLKWRSLWLCRALVAAGKAVEARDSGLRVAQVAETARRRRAQDVEVQSAAVFRDGTHAGLRHPRGTQDKVCGRRMEPCHLQDAAQSARRGECCACV